MRELIKNAWIGWMDYTETGKLAALLLLALLLFWFVGKEYRNRHMTLALYTTVMAVCCICPLTAAVLMTYQTRFYDYQWIWNMVPVTIFIALAGTLLWFELTEKYVKGKNGKLKCVGITAVMVALIYLCGPMMKNIWSPEEVTVKQTETAKVLERITENGQNKDITLWAPKETMEYARAVDGSIRLPYGRNMWDPALNAYSYDTYGHAEDILYAWMSYAEETGGGETITATQSMDLAKQLGVTHILLPGNLQPEVLAEIEEYLEVQAETVEGYYLIRVG